MSIKLKDCWNRDTDLSLTSQRFRLSFLEFSICKHAIRSENSKSEQGSSSNMPRMLVAGESNVANVTLLLLLAALGTRISNVEGCKAK